MIRLLHEYDRPALAQLLNAEPRFNLYMLGNLNKLGFSQDFCQFWGDVVSEQGQPQVRGALNRYMTGWTIYGRADADWAGLAAILDDFPERATRLQDNPGGVASFLPFLQGYGAEKVESEELMELAVANFRPVSPPPGIQVRRATLADLSALSAFYAEAGDMARTAAAVARPLRDTRLWLAEEQGAILATALTNAEMPVQVMIGGVFTRPEQRGRGLSQAVCSALCRELLAEGKQPLLYWRNPAAGTVYRKLGFRTVGLWRAAWLAPI
jgi:predicted GNAT family acetyltransferase